MRKKGKENKNPSYNELKNMHTVIVSAESHGSKGASYRLKRNYRARGGQHGVNEDKRTKGID